MEKNVWEKYANSSVYFLCVLIFKNFVYDLTLFFINASCLIIVAVSVTVIRSAAEYK